MGGFVELVVMSDDWVRGVGGWRVLFGDWMLRTVEKLLVFGYF